MNSPDQRWTPCIDQLDVLASAIQAAQTAALDSISQGDADFFVQRCHELSRVLAQAQPLLQQALGQDRPPTHVLLKLQQVQAGLTALQSLQTRLSATTQKALGVVFPADQVKAYSRLGGGRGLGGGLAGSAYLKA
jgi:hypothetical protein